MATTRDEFTPKNKLTLALRAGHFCSNPHCLKLTAGPHSDPGKSLITGHAAHIHAAAKGGPRYDATQSPEQRKALANGIWLCRDCGDIVDKDSGGYTGDDLRGWKANHEVMIHETRTQGYAASLVLLQSNSPDPQVAGRIIQLFEDRRVFWAVFDAERPTHVRLSLDGLRRDLTHLRHDVRAGGPMDVILVSLGETIRRFYDHVARIDLDTLCCDSGDPKWRAFEGALRALRKAIGLQIVNLADAYGITLQGEFASIVEIESF